MQLSRRTLVKTGLVTGGAAALSAPPLDTRPSAAATLPSRTPFNLGVASGDPFPTSVIIWTRLAVNPLAENGLGGMSSSTQTLQWQVASDATFSRIVRSGTVAAMAANAHSVHVEVNGLLPGREYYYRFRLGPKYISRVGRTRTAPAADELPASLAMSFLSCAAWEPGWFTSYRRLAEDEPELVLHLGDFMYEYGRNFTANGVRDNSGPETITLANYRQRHAQYKTDTDLKVALAAAPWVVVFDDHEVSNNWADETPASASQVPGFMNRRAAAFKAYYENMPLRASSIPSGPDMRLHRRLQWGRLANLHMLDTRQYRNNQACGDGWDDCPAADDPSRSILGTAQEQWLADGFASSRATWDVLGQQVFFSRRDRTATPDNTVEMDAWDGYRPSRARVTNSWVRAQVRNPIVLTGDVHAHWGSDVLADFSAPDSPVVGSEFVCSSVSSGGDGYDEPTGRHPWAAHNPHLKFWTNLRGYVNTRITPESFTADYRCVPKVSVKGAAAFTRARFVVDDGVRGMRQVTEKTAPATAERAPSSNAEKIRDTIKSESQ